MDNANVTNDFDPLHTKAEAAPRLRSSVRSVERLLCRRELTFVRIGHRIFIPESAIRDFLERSTRPAVVGQKRAA